MTQGGWHMTQAPTFDVWNWNGVLCLVNDSKADCEVHQRFIFSFLQPFPSDLELAEHRWLVLDRMAGNTTHSCCNCARGCLYWRRRRPVHRHEPDLVSVFDV